VIRRDRNASVTLHQLLTWYFDQSETRERHSSTLRRYQTAAQSLRRLLPDVLVRDLRPQHIQDYVRARRDEGCAPATVKFEVSVLKIIFQRGVRHDFLSEVPIKNWPVIEVRNARDRTLTDAEWARLRAALSPRLRPIVELAWHTGMRQGEILGLEWNQVDLQSGFIRLRADQTKQAPHALGLCNDSRLASCTRRSRDRRFRFS